MRFNSAVFPLTCCFALSGCATQPIYVPLPASHPASPWACESPMPPQSGTLAINKSEMVPPHPDWQIPGMRDNELHGHAAGEPTTMDMMGHGMMMKGGHGAMGAGHAPGMIKMSAPPDKVDYAPVGAHHPGGPEPAEHKPEMHLDHTDPERRRAGYKAAPIAPPMDMDMKQGMDGMDMKKGMYMDETPAETKKAVNRPTTPSDTPTPSEHEAMGHSPAGAAPAPAETPAPPTPAETHAPPTPADTPIPPASPAPADMPAMDHSQHAM